MIDIILGEWSNNNKATTLNKITIKYIVNYRNYVEQFNELASKDMRPIQNVVSNHLYVFINTEILPTLHLQNSNICYRTIKLEAKTGLT